MKKIYLVLAFMILISDLNAKIIYLSPSQNAKYVSLENNIIIGFDETVKSSDLNSLITVTGSLSGNHEGKITIVENGKKILFKPFQPFVLNETVEVRLNNIKTAFNKSNSLTYSFQTPAVKLTEAQMREYQLNNEFSEKLPFEGSYGNLPPLTVNIKTNPSPGRILLCSELFGAYNSNIQIVNNDGSVYRSDDRGGFSIHFERQKNGMFTIYENEIYYQLDSNFNRVDSFYCGNGYTTDQRDVVLLNNGHALVMAYDPQPYDMSVIYPGGNPNATVVGLIVQEIDENKDVVFQWSSWDVFDVLDGRFGSFTNSFIDPFHGNAIEDDSDGNIIFSSRNSYEITKISRSTGDIIWRFGGGHNQFTYANDTIPFQGQHNVSRLANGNITIFDNGNNRTPQQYTRALEYSLDEVNKVATLVWSYIHSPVSFSQFQGSVQRLRNGNTMIGWGKNNLNTTLTEVTPSGEIVLEMSFPAGNVSYRALRDEYNLTLNIRMATEGMYNTVTDNLNRKDTVTVFVRNVTSPYAIVDSVKTSVDSVTMNAICSYYNVYGGTYYISVKHRNGLETWSKAGGETFVTNGAYIYDFRSAAAMAFGDNQVLKGSKYCIYSGDINQDGIIDATDLSGIENDAMNSLTGYVTTDLNGDDIVDATDISIVDTNVSEGEMTITP